MVQHQSRDTLDTSLIVHYIVGDIPKQRRAVARLLDSENTVHAVPVLAMSEAVYVFETHYGHDRTQVVANLRDFLNIFDDVLDYDRELFDMVLPCYESRPSLSFNDCCLAFGAEVAGAEPLFTFDRKLARQHPSAKLL